jgi:hypothetical protein
MFVESFVASNSTIKIQGITKPIEPKHSQPPPTQTTHENPQSYQNTAILNHPSHPGGGIRAR